MGVLAEIERVERRRIRLKARQDPHLPVWRAFFLSFCITPVLIFESMFVALFGPLLVLLGVLLSLVYLVVRASFRLWMAALSGVILSGAGLVALGGAFGRDLHMPMAYLLAASTGTTIVFIFTVAGAIVALFERASVDG